MDQRTVHSRAVDALLDERTTLASELNALRTMNQIYEDALIRVAGRSCEHDDLLTDLRGLHAPLEDGEGKLACMECGLPSPCRTMRLLI